MSNNPTRRDVLIAFGATGALTPLLAQHVHQAVGEVKSLDPGPNYKPKYLNAHEYATLRKLSDFIIPADEHSKGALDAGAAEFIDYLCAVNDRMAQSFTGGLAWMDDEMQRRVSKTFIGATREEQTKLLDEISYRKNKTAANVTGVTFFAWCRGIVIDAYYTSPVGIADVGFMGNQVLSSFSVPEEAIRYAVSRSPFANG
jgi:gluconate 2-dehydrogenase gamma chain